MSSELIKNIYRIVFFCVRVSNAFGGIKINTENIANYYAADQQQCSNENSVLSTLSLTYW